MTSATRTAASCHQSILNERLNDRIRESDAEMARTPAQSLARSAAIFRAAGQHFSADFTANMVAGAEDMPEVYAHWADAQAERAGRIAR